MKNRKFACWIKEKQIKIRQGKIPKLKKGEILLKVKACAVCGSDIRIFNHGNPRVKSGTIIGHEIAGDIEDTGKGVKKFKKGDKVALGADIPCAECEHCLTGRANCCDINYAIGHQLEGGFTEYMVLPKLVVEHGPLHKFKKATYEEATLAEPLACCINGYEVGLINQRKIKTVVIFGAGPIGILLAILGKTYGAKKIIIIDINTKRLEIAKKITKCDAINSKKVNPIKKVMSITNNKGADIIFTACPDIRTHEEGIKMLGKRGVINLFGGVPKNSNPISFYSNDIHYKEAYITGSHGSTPKQHKEALAMIEKGIINLKPLITHKFKLEDIELAYNMVAFGNAIKVIITPNGRGKNV